jgi:hypothetical protein
LATPLTGQWALVRTSPSSNLIVKFVTNPATKRYLKPADQAAAELVKRAVEIKLRKKRTS